MLFVWPLPCCPGLDSQILCWRSGACDTSCPSWATRPLYKHSSRRSAQIQMNGRGVLWQITAYISSIASASFQTQDNEQDSLHNGSSVTKHVSSYWFGAWGAAVSIFEHFGFLIVDMWGRQVLEQQLKSKTTTLQSAELQEKHGALLHQIQKWQSA